MPSNVMIRQWLPQNVHLCLTIDLSQFSGINVIKTWFIFYYRMFSHTKMSNYFWHMEVKYSIDKISEYILIKFICLSQSGIFGTQESVHWAVPMVFIPIYSDQFRNAKRCVDAGFAEIISFHEISVKNLYEKLNVVLNEKRYTEQVNLVSQQFRDNLVDPMQETMYHIEFVARHKANYPIFKPHAPNVPWYTYNYLDIIVVLLITVYTTFAFTKYALKRVWQRYDIDQSNKQKVN